MSTSSVFLEPPSSQVISPPTIIESKNNTPKKAEVKNMEAKPLVQVLGNIDNRIQELEEKREKLLAFEE